MRAAAFVIGCSSILFPALVLSAEPTFVITFAAEPTRPGDSSKSDHDESLYESKVTVSEMIEGSLREIGEFRGSIYPNDMSTSGKIKDGEYSIQLGFHARSDDAGKPLAPTKEDLVAKKKGTLRPTLVVNKDGTVPCVSDNAKKVQMNLVHIHSGFNTERGSEGCLTIAPNDWDQFIGIFLTKFPDLGFWHAKGAFYSKEIGTLLIKKAVK